MTEWAPKEIWLLEKADCDVDDDHRVIWSPDADCAAIYGPDGYKAIGRYQTPLEPLPDWLLIVWRMILEGSATITPTESATALHMSLFYDMTSEIAASSEKWRADGTPNIFADYRANDKEESE